MKSTFFTISIIYHYLQYYIIRCRATTSRLLRSSPSYHTSSTFNEKLMSMYISRRVPYHSGPRILSNYLIRFFGNFTHTRIEILSFLIYLWILLCARSFWSANNKLVNNVPNNNNCNNNNNNNNNNYYYYYYYYYNNNDNNNNYSKFR